MSSSPLLDASQKGTSRSPAELLRSLSGVHKQYLSLGAVVNIANAIIGSGILLLPLTIERTGIYLGFAFVVTSAVITFNSCEILRVCCDFTGEKSHSGIAFCLFGQGVYTVSNMAQGLFSFGTMTGYLTICGSELFYVFALIHKTYAFELPYAFMDSQDFLISVVTVVVVLPLALLRDMKSLQFTSFLGVACASYIVAVIALNNPGTADACSLAENASYNCVENKCIVDPRTWSAEFSSLATCSKECEGDSEHQTDKLVWVKLGSGAFQSIPVLVFAFNCAIQTVPVITGMKRQQASRVRLTIFMAVFICFLAYIPAALGGYVAFCSQACPNILDCFPADDLYILVARVCLITTLLFGFPLYSFNVRLSVQKQFGLLSGAASSSQQTSSDILTVVVVLSTLILSITFNNISTVLGLTGAVCGMTVTLILPGLYYTKIGRMKEPIINSPMFIRQGSSLPLSWGGTCHMLKGYMFIVLGTIFMFVCSYVIITQ